ncbi:Cys-tRNA(Pro) deacylase [Colwellia sp. KU-HH00111]
MMTPATKQLEQNNVRFQVLQYQHQPSASSYGLEAVEKLALNADQVFKTLVVCTDTDKLAVAIIPVKVKLNLKAIAKVLQVKKVKMAEAKRVETTTGYILGGVSPLGQKKQLTTVIDASAEKFEEIYVSGGRRGLEIELAPKDLARLCQAKFATISN